MSWPTLVFIFMMLLSYEYCLHINTYWQILQIHFRPRVSLKFDMTTKKSSKLTSPLINLQQIVILIFIIVPLRLHNLQK